MDYLCDLHTHCVLSRHAYSSLTENYEYAVSIGLKYYGNSDHQPDHFDVGASRDAFLALEHVPRKIANTNFLRGIELNIIDNGMIDLMGVKENHIDYSIASIHTYAYKGKRDKQTVTNMYLNALDYPFVTILGHIDDGHFEVDYEKVVKKAKEKHKLIELNNSSLKPTTHRLNTWENDKEILKLCLKYNQPIIINSDAHIKYNIGTHNYVDELIEELSFPKEMILNYNEELFKEYFKVYE